MIRVAAIGGAAALALAALGAHVLASLELREIRVGKGSALVTPDDVRAVTRDLGTAMIGLDLAEVRARVEAFPNVRSATVRRAFPGRLLIDVEGHQPLARWAHGGLVNIQGEIYPGVHRQWLPIFDGPGSRLVEMTEYLSYVRARLGEHGQGLRLVQMHLSDLGEWRLVLSNGWMLNLGSRDIHARIRRFVATHAEISARITNIVHLDLRYPNGIAVRGEVARAQDTGKEGKR